MVYFLPDCNDDDDGDDADADAGNCR